MDRQQIPPVVPGKHDRPGRHRALLEAATAAFAERGFEGATTREVAERANCSEGLIHRYFKGKRGLLLAILTEKGQAAAEFDAGLPQHEDLAAEIEQILLAHLHHMWERRDFLRVAVSQSIIDPELGRLVGGSINRGRVLQVASRLHRHRRAGHIRTGVDVERLAAGLAGLGFALGFMQQVVFAEDRARIEAAARETATAIASGIRAAPASPASGPLP